MRTTLSVLGFLFCFISALTIHAQTSKKRHWMTEENIDRGRVIYRIFEEDLSLSASLNQISQNLIFETVDTPKNRPVISKVLKNVKQLHVDKDLFRSGKPLWVAVKDQWTEADEEDYRLWFIQNVNAEFNRNSGVMANCADVAVLFRWIYAREKKLPVANTLQGASKKLFGHFSGSAAWDKLPTDPDWKKDERFKAALRYVLNNTYTRSIIDDLYPTEMTPKYVHEGSVYMIIRLNSGHAQTISKIDSQNIGLVSLWGNEPGTENIFKSWLIWEPSMKNLFGMWRWPILKDGVWTLTPAQEMPGYSEEQFIQRKQLGEAAFREWVLGRLGLIDYDEVRLGRLLSDMKSNLSYRVPVTMMGAVICGSTPCDPKSLDYDNYSTDSRDKRLKEYRDEAVALITKLGGFTHPDVTQIISNAGLDGELLSGVGIKYVDFLTSDDLIKNIKPGANFSFLARWGIDESTLDATAKFKSLHQQLLSVFYTRINYVIYAGRYCKEGCDPSTSTSLAAYNTDKIDAGLIPLAEKNTLLLQGLEIPTQVIEDISNIYRRYELFSDLKIKTEYCEEKKHCTLYDVILKDNRFQQVTTWTPYYYQPTIGRWGIPEL